MCAEAPGVLLHCSVLVARHPDMLHLMRDNPEMAQKIWIDSASLQAAEQQR